MILHQTYWLSFISILLLSMSSEFFCFMYFSVLGFQFGSFFVLGFFFPEIFYVFIPYKHVFLFTFDYALKTSYANFSIWVGVSVLAFFDCLFSQDWATVI